MIRVKLDARSWHRGRAAGMMDDRPTCPRDVPDELAYYRGYIEGKALREQRGAFLIVEAQTQPVSRQQS